MEPRRPHPHGLADRERRLRVRRARLTALGSLTAVAAVALVIVLSTTGGSSSHAPTAARSSAVGTNTTNSGGVTAPILAYHVINEPPAQSALPPSLYLPADQFTA